MSLESTTNINGLVATNPLAGDLKSQGDDHIRLLKTVLKTTFPNMASAVWASVNVAAPLTLASTHNFNVLHLTAAVAVDGVAATVGASWCAVVVPEAVGASLFGNTLTVGRPVLVFCNGTTFTEIEHGGDKVSEVFSTYDPVGTIQSTMTLLVYEAGSVPVKMTLAELQGWLIAAAGLTTDFTTLTAAVFPNGTELFPVNQVDSIPKKLNLQNVIDLAALQAHTWTLAQTFGANMTLAGTGLRIRGDFSAATLTNRLHFQTSVTNGNTLIGVLSNGTGVTTGINLFNASAPGDASKGQMLIDGTAFTFDSTAEGSGIPLPIMFKASGVETGRIDTAGRWLLGVEHDSTFDLGAPNAELLIGNTTTGIPATADSIDPATAVSVQMNNARLDIGAYADGRTWIQPRAVGNNAVNYDLVLCPNGGAVSLGSGSLSLPGFTALGTGAPAIKMKKLTGTSPTAGNVASVAHGLDSTKIIAITGLIKYDAVNSVAHGYTQTVGNQFMFSLSFDATNAYVSLTSASTSVASKPFTLLLTYEE